MTEQDLFLNCIRTIRRLKQSLSAFREGNEDQGIRIYREALNPFQSLIMEGFVPAEEAAPLLSDLTAAQEAGDFVLLADLMELRVLPMMLSLWEMIRQEVPIEKRRENYLERNLSELEKTDPELAQEIRKAYAGLKWFTLGGERETQNPDEAYSYLAEDGTEYHVDETVTGNQNLRIVRDGRSSYLSSNADPIEAADRYVKRQLSDRVPEHVIVVGLGLGHVPGALLENTLNASRIHVYEPDIHVLAVTLRHVDFRYRFPMCRLFWDPKMEKAVQELKTFDADRDLLMIQGTSLDGIRDEKRRDTFRQFLIRDNSERNAEKLLAVNFRENMAREGIRPAEELASRMRGKTVYIIAAGPSLDRNIAQLKQRDESDFILATGTVYIKLMRMGIRPDALIVTDPNPRVVRQIREYYESDVPMIFLSTAARGYGEKYRGSKYYLLQEGYPGAEKKAKEDGSMLVETGGSVSTTALDFAIRSNPAAIIFLGLDLAFTGNLAHADGTSSRLAPNQEKLSPVEDWNRKGIVYSDDKFTIYRKWITRRLAKPDAAGITIINATEGGSFVEGMKHISLSEARLRQTEN